MKAALAVLVLAVAAFGGTPSRGGLVFVDPATNAVSARISSGGEPLRVTFGAGAFWVVAPEAGAVIRVDARTNAVKRIRLGEEPFDAATGDGALFVPDHDGFDVLRVDLRTGGVSRSRKLGVPQLAAAFAFGAVWVVAADESLRRLDPRTLRVTATIAGVASSSPGFEPKIGVAKEALWISDEVKHSVARVDPRRLRVTQRVAKAGYGVAVGGGTVWSGEGYTEVWRIAPGRPLRIAVAGNPVDVAADRSIVWVAARFGHALVRIDGHTARVRNRIPLGREAVAVAVGLGRVAVAVR